MRYAETLWTFETANLIVKWDVAPDLDVDTSFDETGEVDEKLSSGEWVAFESHVYVVHKETGTVLCEDYLGGSIYEDPKTFRDHFGMNANGHGSYFSDMVRTACAEARKQLAALKSMNIRH